MKYYSDVLKKVYDTEEDCLKAEKAYKDKLDEEARKREKLANERKARAQEVEGAYKKIIEARENYQKLVDAFVADYGAYHMTFSSTDLNKSKDWKNLFDDFFKFF